MTRSNPSVVRRLWDWKQLRVILLLTTVVFAVLWVASFPNHLDPVKTGSLGQWLSAIGTTSAFAVTFVQLRRNIRQQADLDLDKRRAQASSVSAWAESALDATNFYSVGVKLRNGSMDPVWETWCRSFSGAEEYAAFEDQSVGLVPPQAEPWLDFEPREVTTTDVTVEIKFRDSNGVTWLRRRNGSLQELTDAEAAAWDARATPTGVPGQRRGPVSAKV